MKKKSNSRKMIIGLIFGLALVATFMILINVLEESNESSGLFYVGNAEMYEIINDTSGEGFFVYVGRPTCPQCTAFQPTLEEALEYLDQELRYFQADLAAQLNDESEMTTGEIAQELGVTTVPRILYIENGEVIDQITGNRQLDDVLSFFENNGGLN